MREVQRQNASPRYEDGNELSLTFWVRIEIYEGDATETFTRKVAWRYMKGFNVPPAIYIQLDYDIRIHDP